MSENNGYISPYIGDGYDERATIPPHPGKWSQIVINYRCMTALENSEVLLKNRLFPNTPMVQHFAELFATKIQGWDIKDREGRPLPISANSINGLGPAFYELLFSYMEGTLPSDTRRASLEAEIKNS